MFQLLSYIVRIWEKRLRDGWEFFPVVPLVVYHSESSWTPARSMTELLRAPEALAAYPVQLRLPLLDLSCLADDEIEGEAILRSTLRTRVTRRPADGRVAGGFNCDSDQASAATSRSPLAGF